MNEIIDPETGVILYIEDADSVLEFIKHTMSNINILKEHLEEAKQVLIDMATFTSSNTARVEGKIHKCKIELPSKIKWDQNKLSHLLWKYPSLTNEVIKIGNYKVNMPQYKAIMNTSKNHDIAFCEFKKELMEANLGKEGKIRVIIE
ncbi:MAG: hypothetical protein E6H10_19210 [Bacteroidetes bacterium]|nr:MAG: hypothetical protein E6H10_19210 [Bacteroidota bacterium]